MRVPFGSGSRIGVITSLPECSDFPVAQLKTVAAVLRDLPALPPDWFRLSEFCSAYYQVPLGEVMLSTLPAGLRRIKPSEGAHEPPSSQVATGARTAATHRRARNRIEADYRGRFGFKAYLLHGA